MTAALNDADLDSWCEIYRANPMLHRAMTLQQFLADPESRIRDMIFNRVMPGTAGDFKELLPRQRAVLREHVELEAMAVGEELEQQLIPECDCRVAGGAWVQPLHHHRYDVSHDRDHRRIKR